MAKERNIAMVATKINLKEAEANDDLYWSNTSEEYRLRALIDLRVMVYGNIGDQSIEKVVYKRSVHEKVEH